MMWRTEKSAERPGFDLSGYLISSEGELDYRHNDLGRLGEQIGAFRTRTATVDAPDGGTFELTPRMEFQASVASGGGYGKIIVWQVAVLGTCMSDCSDTGGRGYINK